MTLDEAIKHAEEVAILNENTCKAKPDSNLKKYKKCAEEHRQLAEWLKELKILREQTQEPCEDAVSRKRLMDNYNGVETPVGYRKVVDMEVIKNMPSVTPATRWIPVSERLPKERKPVLVYCLERKNIYCAYYEEKQWWIYGAYFTKIEEDVMAWQPLPEAYKESEVER